MQSLAELVERLGPLRVRDAIGWTLRTALSVWELHRQDRAHGRISPEAVEIELADCSSDGVLRWAARLDNVPTYHSAERGEEGKASPEDDVWAIGCLLYFLLTGSPPYPSGAAAAMEGDTLKPPPPLAVHNGDLDVMQPVVDRLLDTSRGDRAKVIEDVVAGLQDFSPAIADLPPLMVEAPTTSLPPPAHRFPQDEKRGGKKKGGAGSTGLDGRTKAMVFGLVAVGCLGLGAAVVLRGSGQQSAPPTRPTATATAATPAAGPSTTASTAAPPVATGSAPAKPTEDLMACMSPYLPKGSFKITVNEDFPCRELKPDKVDRRVIVALAKGSGGEGTSASRDWSQLGWYRLAAMTYLRSRCCAQPPPLKTPALLRTCGIDPALAALSKAETDDDVAAALESYGEAMRCAHAAGGGALLGVEGPPTKTQGAIFIRMLTRARKSGG